MGVGVTVGVKVGVAVSVGVCVGVGVAVGVAVGIQGDAPYHTRGNQAIEFSSVSATGTVDAGCGIRDRSDKIKRLPMTIHRT